MQFVVFMELVGTLVLPAAIAFTIYIRKATYIRLVHLSADTSASSVHYLLAAERDWQGQADHREYGAS
jgi:hypothetical protein